MDDNEAEFWRRSNEARGYATLGLTGLYIVHGGALTALLTAFSDELLKEGGGLSVQPQALIAAFILYAAGIALTLNSSLFGYFAAMGRAPIETDEGWKDRIPIWLADTQTVIGELSAAASLLLFVLGSVFAGLAIW